MEDRVPEVLRPDPDPLAFTARPQLLMGWLSGQSGTASKNKMRSPELWAAGRRKEKPLLPQLQPRFPKSTKEDQKKETNPTSPPPLGMRRSAIGPRGCHSRALSLEKAPGRRQSPHISEDCGGGCVVWPSSPHPRPEPISTLRVLLSPCLPSLVPLPPATDGSPQDGDHSPGRGSHSGCQRQASGLSRPLNSRERARARRPACDWLHERGRRRSHRGASVLLPFLFPPLSPKGEVLRLGTRRGRSFCEALPSDWFSGNVQQPR